jgi:hypothetical protein
MQVPNRLRPHGARCHARTRGGHRCQHEAGWGTDHVGQGRCKLHGGCSPIKHGRYSTVVRPSIQWQLLHLPPRERDLLIELACFRLVLLDARAAETVPIGPLLGKVEAVIRAILRGRYDNASPHERSISRGEWSVHGADVSEKKGGGIAE